MTAAERSSARLSRLSAELRADRLAFVDKCDEIARYSTPGLGVAQKPVLALVAVDLFHAYRALEAMLERSVVVFEGELPSGPEWHRELLELASLEIPGVRPAILSADSRDASRPLLSFRHFFSKAYAVELDPKKLMETAADLTRGRSAIERDLDAFLAFLASAAEEASKLGN